MTTKIGTVSPVELRKVWPKEDADFAAWLTTNIAKLDRVLGIGLKDARSEQPADAEPGIVSEIYDDSVAIESQYGPSDHKHFGQLLTYICQPDQKISQGIWLVEKARDEHVKAVERLNEAETVRIWMVEVRAIRIGDSLPAPVFEVAVAPPDIKPLQIKRRAFWTALFAQASEDGIDSPFKGLSPNGAADRTTPARGQRLLYRVAVKHGEARIIVTNTKPRNKPGTWLGAYDELKADSDDIAREFAAAGPQRELHWWDDRSDSGRWRVTYLVDVSLDEPDKERLRELNQAATAIKAVFGPRIDRLADNLEDALLEPSRNNGEETQGLAK